MPLITANGVGVINGTIQMPLTGIWTADLVINQSNNVGFDAGSAVEIKAADGFTLHGTVAPFRTGDFIETIHIRVLGGSGGMATTATPQGFVQPGAYARDVINVLMADAKQTLSSTTDANVLATNIVAWSILGVPVSRALNQLLDIVAPGVNWRILPDGTLWIGAESWPTVQYSYDLIERNPTNATYVFGVSSPSIVPGVTIDGIGKINRVEHSILPKSLRSNIWIDIDSGDRGMAPSIVSLAKQAFPGIDYLAFYDATVVAQSDDFLTVDVQPSDSRIPGMTKVPLRHGLPGCKVQISSGSILRVGWDRGNPSIPFAALWNGAETVQLIQLAGTIPVAREGDNLSASSAFSTWAGQVETGITGAGGVAPSPLFAVGVGVPGGVGTINQGSDIVKVG